MFQLHPSAHNLLVFLPEQFQFIFGQFADLALQLLDLFLQVFKLTFARDFWQLQLHFLKFQVVLELLQFEI